MLFYYSGNIKKKKTKKKWMFGNNRSLFEKIKLHRAFLSSLEINEGELISIIE